MLEIEELLESLFLAEPKYPPIMSETKVKILADDNFKLHALRVSTSLESYQYQSYVRMIICFQVDLQEYLGPSVKVISCQRLTVLLDEVNKAFHDGTSHLILSCLTPIVAECALSKDPYQATKDAIKQVSAALDDLRLHRKGNIEIILAPVTRRPKLENYDDCSDLARVGSIKFKYKDLIF